MHEYPKFRFVPKNNREVYCDHKIYNLKNSLSFIRDLKCMYLNVPFSNTFVSERVSERIFIGLYFIKVLADIFGSYNLSRLVNNGGLMMVWG